MGMILKALLGSKWMIWAGVAALGVIAAFGGYQFLQGMERARQQCDSEKAEAVQRAIAEAERLAAEDREILEAAETVRRETVYKYRTIINEANANEDVSNNCTYTPDFERLLINGYKAYSSAVAD